MEETIAEMAMISKNESKYKIHMMSPDVNDEDEAASNLIEKKPQDKSGRRSRRTDGYSWRLTETNLIGSSVDEMEISEEDDVMPELSFMLWS